MKTSLSKVSTEVLVCKSYAFLLAKIFPSRLIGFLLREYAKMDAKDLVIVVLIYLYLAKSLIFTIVDGFFTLMEKTRITESISCFVFESTH